MFEETGFPLNRLAIEITESVLINNFDWAKAIAQVLKELGCHLAKDDFGPDTPALTAVRSVED